eukprot:1154736-Pelagomonas_calceolata.AAC.1
MPRRRCICRAKTTRAIFHPEGSRASTLKLNLGQVFTLERSEHPHEMQASTHRARDVQLGDHASRGNEDILCFEPALAAIHSGHLYSVCIHQRASSLCEHKSARAHV